MSVREMTRLVFGKVGEPLRIEVSGKDDLAWCVGVKGVYAIGEFYIAYWGGIREWVLHL